MLDAGAWLHCGLLHAGADARRGLLNAGPRLAGCRRRRLRRALSRRARLTWLPRLARAARHRCASGLQAALTCRRLLPDGWRCAALA